MLLNKVPRSLMDLSLCPRREVTAAPQMSWLQPKSQNIGGRSLLIAGDISEVVGSSKAGPLGPRGGPGFVTWLVLVTPAVCRGSRPWCGAHSRRPTEPAAVQKPGRGQWKGTAGSRATLRRDTAARVWEHTRPGQAWYPSAGKHPSDQTSQKDITGAP